MTDNLTTKHKKALQEPDNAEREAIEEIESWIYDGEVKKIRKIFKEALQRAEERGKQSVLSSMTNNTLLTDIAREAEERGMNSIRGKHQCYREGLLKGAEMVLDDRFAIQFQTMGQYRTALAQAIRKEAEK